MCVRRRRKLLQSRTIVESVSCCFTLRQKTILVFGLMVYSCTVYKKHYPPALDDEVWRLEKIGKDGAFHKKLNKAGIYNVKEFLRLMVKDAQKLRTVSALSYQRCLKYLS